MDIFLRDRSTRSRDGRYYPRRMTRPRKLTTLFQRGEKKGTIGETVTLELIGHNTLKSRGVGGGYFFSRKNWEFGSVGPKKDHELSIVERARRRRGSNVHGL